MFWNNILTISTIYFFFAFYDDKTLSSMLYNMFFRLLI